MSTIQRKLDTLIRALPDAPYREHLRTECEAQAARIAELKKMRDEADEVEGSLRGRIAELEAGVERLRKPLTPEHVWQLWAQECKVERPTVELVEAFARAIEAAKEGK